MSEFSVSPHACAGDALDGAHDVCTVFPRNGYAKFVCCAYLAGFPGCGIWAGDVGGPQMVQRDCGFGKAGSEVHRRPPSDGPGCIKSHRGNGMEWNHQLGKLEFRAQSCVSFQRAKASGFGSSGSGHSHVQHAKAPGGSSGSSGSRHSHASISARQVGSLGRPHASGEPHISLSRDAHLWEAILVWSPLKGIGLWQNGLVQIKFFFFQINPEAIVPGSNCNARASGR